MKICNPCCVGLALMLATSAHAAESKSVAGKGLQEVPDAELGLMRGRYTVGGNAVAWFGVTMISTWQTQTGQTLQGAMRLGMDFTKGNTPKVSFTPTVSITDANAPLPDTSGRSIDASGLQNVAGLTQSIQVAGDGNRASNVTHLNVRNGTTAPDGSGVINTSAIAQNGNATAQVQFDGNAAKLLLQVDGLGAVEQWVRSGSVGQTIQLMGDGQLAGNRLQIDLVRSALADNVPLTQNVAQAITLARGLNGAGAFGP
ncbi:hypothetical protein ARC78_00435 [Stenotrophomonas pictorum JCM 9942]|jgi:hypothetical protein|uniref:Uncharacterized protein n=1 Tax=Stenotrophomonas pictorum JCM 9942 TaxID=1236960 RepID=A0A0R0AK86_9GAMM|nr:hypothetical protein [Stenotrophomonas pictorum]KRG45461.1 hypothetical protein ARC78_00435 [Stenotrophomonas pictorum JCM 9942]